MNETQTLNGFLEVCGRENRKKTASPSSIHLMKLFGDADKESPEAVVQRCS